jgi:hypothetical protein
MSKYDIHKTKKLKFARYGGLSSVNQKGYDPHSTDFHGPPTRRGFYCFVWPYVELFLLGSDCTKNPKIVGAKFTYVRDATGVVVTDLHPDYENFYSKRDNYWSVDNKRYSEFYEKHKDLGCDDYDKLWATYKEPKYYLVEKPAPRVFEYDGVLWHHLGGYLKPHLILATKGSWVKTDAASYRYALECKMHDAQKNMMTWCYKDVGDKYKVIPSRETALRRSIKDYLECFIEKL